MSRIGWIKLWRKSLESDWSSPFDRMLFHDVLLYACGGTDDTEMSIELALRDGKKRRTTIPMNMGEVILSVRTVSERYGISKYKAEEWLRRMVEQSRICLVCSVDKRISCNCTKTCHNSDSTVVSSEILGFGKVQVAPDTQPDTQFSPKPDTQLGVRNTRKGGHDRSSYGSIYIIVNYRVYQDKNGMSGEKIGCPSNTDQTVTDGHPTGHPIFSKTGRDIEVTTEKKLLSLADSAAFPSPSVSPMTSPSASDGSVDLFNDPPQPEPSKRSPKYTPAFEAFWASYPLRNPGRSKGSKPLAMKAWSGLSAEDRDLAAASVPMWDRSWSLKNHEIVPDAERFIKRRLWESTPTLPDGVGKPQKAQNQTQQAKSGLADKPEDLAFRAVVANAAGLIPKTMEESLSASICREIASIAFGLGLDEREIGNRTFYLGQEPEFAEMIGKGEINRELIRRLLS